MLPMRCTIHTETHRNTRTQTCSERGRERRVRSERGALIARARKKGIRIYDDVYKHTHTHTHTCMDIATTGRAEETSGHTAGYRGWHSQYRKTRLGKERGGWVCTSEVGISKMSKTKIRQRVGVFVILHVNMDTPRMYPCRYMYMHIHTYMRMHIHIYIYTHTHIHR